MWIFTNNAFVSAVRHRSEPGGLMVRARLRGDLERFFDASADVLGVKETRDADYRFRCTVSDAVFATALMQSAAAIDYPNFKSSIGSDDQHRHDAYMDVWSAMHTAQRSAK
jgi:hypothetical protein